MQKKHAPVHAPVQNYDNDEYADGNDDDDDDNNDDDDGDDDDDDDDDETTNKEIQTKQ